MLKSSMKQNYRLLSKCRRPSTKQVLYKTEWYYAPGIMQLHRMHWLEAGPGFRKWKQFTWKWNGSNHEFHLDTGTSRLLIAN